jgi:hypothetical protein
MKVFVYGNTLNIALKLTLILRQKGIDAEMFLDNTSPLQQDYPNWEYPELTSGSYPSWIHYYPIFPNFIFSGTKTKKMIADFGKCDVALVSGWGPILAMKAKVPAVFHSAGTDLNNIAIIDEIKSVFKSKLSFTNRLKKLIKSFTFSPLQKKALKKHTSKIMVSMGYQVNRYINDQGLQHKLVLANFPRDIINYAAPLDEKLYNRYKKYRLVFFMISRHSWKSVWNDIKGNDKFIRAYAKFIKNHHPSALLIMTNKGVDFEASKELVKQEGIEENIEWVQNMPVYQLKGYQSLPNVIMVDNFWHDDWKKRFPKDTPEPKVGFGFACIESLAAKRPIITAFTDREFYEGNTPPILYAFTENEIYNRLVQAYEMGADELKKMGEDGYAFVLKWHEQTAIIDKHISLLQEVYRQASINKK